MLKNRNDNIVISFFKTAAAFWSRTAKYQIFVILAAIALLAILSLFGAERNDTADIILNLVIFCATAAAGFTVLRLKGSRMAAFTFAAALALRLCLVFIFENSTPHMPEGIRTRTSPWIKHYDSVLFQPDEFFYVYQGQKYSNVTVGEFINSPEFMTNAYRAGFLMSRILRFFGDELIWPRIVGVFLGAFAAAFVCLAAEELFSKNTSAIVSLLCVIAPQTVFYSVRFLKEIWVVFAVSLIVFGFVMIIRNKKLLSAILPITTAAIILLWVRFEYSLMFISAIPVAICFRHKGNPVGKTAAILSLILLSTIIFFYQFEQLTNKAEDMLDKYTLKERGKGGRLETVEIIDSIHKSRGPLRLLNIPLALLNPPPKNLHCIYTEENKLYDIVRLADIYQWWILLPFLAIGAIAVIIKRTEFLAFLLPYIAVISISALLLGGLQGGVLRYRDSLAPAAFIIVGAGIEDFITLPKSWKNRIIIAVYAVFFIYAYLYFQLFIFT